MFGSGVIDTAIGLVFVFLLVSMLVTVVNEMIAAFFLSRAKWLRIGIERLLGSKWVDDLYDHPLINGSALKPNRTASDWKGMRGVGPSYIPSRSFANVLLDLVHGCDTTVVDAKKRLQDALDGARSVGELQTQMPSAAAAVRPPAESLGTLSADVARLMEDLRSKKTELSSWAEKLRVISSGLLDPALSSLKADLTRLADTAAKQGANDTHADVEPLVTEFQKVIDSVPYVSVAEAIKKDLGAMLDRLKAGSSLGDAKTAVQRFIDAMPARYLREVIEAFPEPKIRDTLLVLLNDAEHDVEKLKQNIEIWFNNAMDRVGGWYKRRSQLVIAILSLGAAVFMNVDAILVVKYLDTHPGVRDALVTQAKAYADSNATAAKPAAAPAASAAGSAVAGRALVATSGERFEGVLTFGQAASAAGTVELTSNSATVTLREKVVPVATGASGVEFSFDSKPTTTGSDVTISATGAGKGTATVRVDPSLVAKLDQVHDQLLQLNLPIGWVRDVSTSSDKEPQSGAAGVHNAASTPPSTASEPASAAVGKGRSGAARRPPSQAERDNMQVLPTLSTFSDIFAFHIVGWILTALAASLGAPFWFDTLNRFISIRSSGKAPEEAPKPPKNVPVPLEPGQSPREADLSASARR